MEIQMGGVMSQWLGRVDFLYIYHYKALVGKIHQNVVDAVFMY